MTEYTVTKDELMRRIEELTAQRDALLAALEYIVKAQSQPFDHADRRCSMKQAQDAIAGARQ